ncbi:MAG: hypothetical protein ABEJ79_01455 [Halolamina sp.]
MNRAPFQRQRRSTPRGDGRGRQTTAGLVVAALAPPALVAAASSPATALAVAALAFVAASATRALWRTTSRTRSWEVCVPATSICVEA